VTVASAAALLRLLRQLRTRLNNDAALPSASPKPAMTCPADTTRSCPALAGGEATPRPVRWALAGAGIGCVGLGAVGVIVPGLPTTVFLIVATWCFARSCPWLERKLVRNRLFKPFLWALDSGAPMPRRAQVISTVVMWVAISASCGVILARAEGPLAGPLVVVGLICAAGAAGTWCIWRVAGRRGRGRAAALENAERAAAAA
jgi:uncharacterized protein